MRLIEKASTQDRAGIEMEKADIALLLSCASSNKQLPTLCGVTLRLHGKRLTAYASDGAKHARIVAKTKDDYEERQWTLPRKILARALKGITGKEDVRFVIEKEAQLRSFVFHQIDKDNTDVLGEVVEFDDPIPNDTQRRFNFKDVDLELRSEGGTGADSASIPTSAFNVLAKLAKAACSSWVEVILPPAGSAQPIRARSEGPVSYYAAIGSGPAAEPQREEITNSDPSQPLTLQPTPNEKRKSRRGK